MNNIVLWVYIVLLVAGGLAGFLKARSKASLIASVGFAVPLSLAGLGVLPAAVADALLGVLACFFGMRFAKTKAFMPGGLMTILSAVALVLRLLVK